MSGDLGAEGSDIVTFYSKLGMAVLGAVMDGDCGIDTMCAMLQRPLTYDARKEIREELHDYLVERIREPWMQEVMHACQEISTGELAAYRSCGEVDSGQAVTTLAIQTVETEQGCIQLQQNLASDYTDELLDARAWSTGVKDRGMLVSLAGVLHEVLRDAQSRNHARAKLQETQTDAAEPKPVLVYPHTLASRMQAAKLYHDQLRSCGWTFPEKEPYGARTQFLDRVQWAGLATLRRRSQALGRWLRAYLETNNQDSGVTRVWNRKEARRSRPWHERHRASDGGRPRLCTFVR